MRSSSLFLPAITLVSLNCLAATSSAPPVIDGNPAAKLSLRVIPTFEQGASLIGLAPMFFSKLAAASSTSGFAFASVVGSVGSTVPIERVFQQTATLERNNSRLVLPQPNTTRINPLGNPSKIGSIQNNAFQLDLNNSETLTGQPPGSSSTFGPSGSTPLVGDWNGSGSTKVGAYLNGTFYLDINGDGVFTVGTDLQRSLGSGIPVVGDWNGSGTTKIGIFNPTTASWLLDFDGTGQATVTYNNFAPQSGLKPVVGDWSGDGKTKVGWNLNGFWALDYNGNGVWDGETIDRFAGLGGNPGEMPIVGDWSNGNTSKIGFYYQGFWAEDFNGNFAWDGTPTDHFGGFGGNAGEMPVIGDWNGDGRTKVGFYYNSYFTLDYNGDIAWQGPPTDRYFQWSQGASAAVSGRWIMPALQLNCDITPVSAHNIVRSSATDVYTYVQTRALGPGAGYWTPSVTTTETRDGSVLDNRSNITTTAGQGQIATNSWHDPVTTTTGLGTYHTDNSHTLTPNSSSCQGYKATSTTTSDDLTASKPSVSGQNAIWYLGGASDGNYSNTATLSADSGGAPETPQWSVTANGGNVSLSCTSCALPLVRSLNPSANCTYDITIQMSVGGLNADPFQMNVNEPWYLQSGGMSTTTNFGDGWLTLVPYVTRDRCNYLLPSISINEHFGTFTKDNPDYSWNIPSATPLPGSSYTNTWSDQIYITGCTACNPPSQQDNPPNQTGVDQALQFWSVGSTVEQLGIYVQQNLFRRFTGHGEHQSVVRIQN